MKSPRSISSFSPLEVQKFVMPMSLTAILVLAGMVVDTLFFATHPNKGLAIIGLLGILYIISYNIISVRFNNIRISYEIINVFVTGIGLGCLYLILPDSST